MGVGHMTWSVMYTSALAASDFAVEMGFQRQSLETNHSLYGNGLWRVHLSTSLQ